MNKTTKVVLSVLAIALGVFFVGFGGYDDSPGLQGIGLIVVISSIWWMIKTLRRTT